MKATNTRAIRTEAHVRLMRYGAFAEAVAAERAYQRERWGDGHDDGHTPLAWDGLVLRMAGRLAEASAAVENAQTLREVVPALERARERAVKLAAVCLALVESTDRSIARAAPRRPAPVQALHLDADGNVVAGAPDLAGGAR